MGDAETDRGQQRCDDRTGRHLEKPSKGLRGVPEHFASRHSEARHGRKTGWNRDHPSARLWWVIKCNRLSNRISARLRGVLYSYFYHPSARVVYCVEEFLGSDQHVV